MTNPQLEAIYQSAIGISHDAGLRAVYNAGYYAHAGITPDAGTLEQSAIQSAPTAYVKLKDKDR